MPNVNSLAPVSPLPLPPPLDVDGGINSTEWSQWFYQLYDKLLQNGGVFPAVRVQGKDGIGSFTADKNMFQRLLTLDCGLYSDYYSDNGNIIYGFAANVRRSRGDNLTVGAQINAWAPEGGAGFIFGIAAVALGAKNFTGPLVGMETNAANVYDNNQSAKVGLDSVFKDRGDGETTVLGGLGSDRYNYFSSAYWVTSQARSATGERCGWTRGMSFLGQCLDEQVPPAWSAVITYHTGQVVTSGGLCWQAIQDSLNQAPAVPSAFWVQHTAAGTTALAIGIDFSALSTTTIGRISSAIRLRDTMRIDYDVTGAIGTYFDPTVGLFRLANNGTTLRFGVDVGNGQLSITRAAVALGGGAGAALGTIAGAGPAVAGQNSWMPFTHPTLGQVFLPIWI